MNQRKTNDPSDRKTHSFGAFLGIFLGIASIGIALIFGDAWPTLGIGLMLCALTLVVFVLYRAVGIAPHDSMDESPHEMLADAASEAEHQAALDRLAALPHFRRAFDGTLFDYLVGTRVETCGCGRYSPFHLKVMFGEDWSVALVSRGALAQYVAVQEAVAARLTRQTEGC